MGKYILNGCPSGSGYSTYYLNFSVESGTVTPSGGNDIGEGLAFEVTQTAKITVKARVISGQTVDITFKPMIRLASDTDNTFQPYAKTNKELTAENQTLTNNVDVLFETGVKNICPPYLGSLSSNGITYIGNSDGTVTVNGTCSANVGVNIRVYLKAGQYKVSGCPSGGSYSTYRIGVTTDSWTLIGTHDHGNGTTITIPSDGYYRINLDVRAGYVANNLVFKPMITDVDTPESDYDHYVPYAKTNQQLTEKSVTWDDLSEVGAVNYLNSAITTQTKHGATYTNLGDGKYKVGASEAPSHTSNCISTIAITLKKGTYKWTASEDGESPIGSDACYAFIRGLNGTVDWYRSYQSSHGYGVFTLTQDSTIEFGLAVNSSTAFSEITFYPMITPVSYNGPYVPYAKTNKQLTEDTTALLDNTEVNGAVNMLDFTHASEVRKGYTFTNTDGVVTVTGSRASGETGNADHYVNITLTKGTYKVSGCPSGGSDDTWRLLVNINDGAKYAFDYGDGAVFTLTEESSLRVYCTIMANYSDTVNLTFYPMITVPSYNGDYVPYAKSNKELTEDSVDWKSNSVLGAKNFLTTKGTATTQGVEFAVDSNGVFTVTRKSAGSSHAYYSNGRFTLKPGTYIFSNGYNSLPSGIQATYLYNHTDGVYFTNCNNGPKTFTITEEKELAFNIEVQTTQSPSGVKIYPMIRLASDNDATYQPYAKTNRELTKKIDIVGNLFTTTTKVVDNITHGIATTVATLGNLPIGTYVVSGQFNSDSAMSGGGLVQFASSGVIQNGASCNTMINQGFKANAGLTGIFNVTNATNQINLQIYTANADLTVSSARLAAIRIA